LLKILNPKYFLYIMTKILITGAAGFVGRELFKNLKSKKKYLVHTSTRTNQEKLFEGEKNFNIDEIDGNTNWKDALDGVNCIVHCAAKMPIAKKQTADLVNAFQITNVDGTRNLANQAAAIGIKRFIFLSSIAADTQIVNYNDTLEGNDIYGVSKLKAEQALLEVSKQTGLEIVIIRPPLIYGERVKGNFLRLLDLVYKQIPLPFEGINNLRSFIGLDSLVDLIICCIDHPTAEGKTFAISDGEDVSIPDLIKKLSKFMNKSPRLFPVPKLIIQLIGSLLGKSSEIKKLFEDKRIDNSYVHETLGWYPKLSLDESLEKTVHWYLKSR